MSSARDRRLRWLAMVLPALAVACAPPRPVVRQGWTGDLHLETLLRRDLEALLAVADLTAEARLTVSHEQGRDSATASILFRPPALLRLDVRGPLFQHVLTAVIDADTLWAVAGGRRVVMPAADGLDRFLDINLGGYDPRWALLGVVAPAPGPARQVVYPRADRAVVTLGHGAGGVRRLWLDLYRGFVQREEILAPDGTVLWARWLGRYRRLPGTRLYLPAQVRIEGNGRTLELEYRKVTADRGLGRAAFYGGVRD